jgi:hypothetical protein
MESALHGSNGEIEATGFKEEGEADKGSFSVEGEPGTEGVRITSFGVESGLLCDRRDADLRGEVGMAGEAGENALHLSRG